MNRCSMCILMYRMLTIGMNTDVIGEAMCGHAESLTQSMVTIAT